MQMPHLIRRIMSTYENCLLLSIHQQQPNALIQSLILDVTQVKIKIKIELVLISASVCLNCYPTT